MILWGIILGVHWVKHSTIVPKIVKVKENPSYLLNDRNIFKQNLKLSCPNPENNKHCDLR